MATFSEFDRHAEKLSIEQENNKLTLGDVLVGAFLGLSFVTIAVAELEKHADTICLYLKLMLHPGH